VTNATDVPNGDESDEILEALLAAAGLHAFPKDVQRDVDAVLSNGQALEPDARRKLIDAAKRGTREWELREHASLETLLFEARRTRKQDARALAAVIGIDADAIRSTERGESSLHAQPVEVIAVWARALGIDRDLLGDALRRSLAARGSTPAYAGDRNVRLEPAQERLVDEVLRAFDEHTTSPGLT
jgi:hypothetical protein